ncbi:hypothetical protein RhiirB3_391363 [Rhizophagus irregularis]|nr:hypothetical protein RhiirB3_391363 [Rhizophagus irregularis]
MSAISIAMNIELPMKLVKYPGSRNTRHKLSFADKTMRHTTKLESLIRKICKDQDFLIAKDAHWIDYWLNRFNKYNDDYRRKEYDKFIDKYEELIIPTHDLFRDTWINNVKGVVKQRSKIDKNFLQAQRLSKIQESIEKRCNIIHSDIPKWLLSTQDAVKEHIIIDRAVISNKNESVRLAIDPKTIRTHAKDTFAGILRKRNTKSIEQDAFWSNIYRPKGEFTECMANLMDEITLEEWQRTLELVNTNSAPDINGKKSELMVINPKLPRDELYINIGRDNSKVQATDKEIRSTWIISGGNMPIKEIFITHRCLNLLRKIGTSNSYPLIYASQLILPSGHTMSWACYRFIAGLSAKGRIAKWFQLLTRWIKEISAPEMSKHSLFNFLSNILQPVSEDKRKHPYVIIKDKNNEVSIGFVKKRTHIKKNGEKIECLNIEVCNIEIYLDNPQKAIIQKQEHPKMITINQHNALVLPIFIRFSTGATTHIDWYYIVESLNRAKNISENIDIQQLEKIPTINLNGDNLGLWINRWIEQDTLKQELTNIRHQLKSLKNIEYYTDGSLANRTISNNNLSHITDNTTVDLGAAFYTNNELGEFSVYSCLSLWPSSTRAEIVAIFLALLTAPENSNVTIYTDSLGAINSINSAFNSTTRTWLKKTNNLIIIKIIMLIKEAAINLKLYFPVFIDNPIEVNIRRFILKILATDKATEWSLLKNN